MWHKIKVIGGVLLLGGLSIWLIGGGIDAGSTTPGTVNDPLVTKSYVDMKVAEVAEVLSTLVTDGTTDSGTTSSQLSMSEIEDYVDEAIATTMSDEIDSIATVIVEETIDDALDDAIGTAVEAAIRDIALDGSDGNSGVQAGSLLFAVLELVEGDRLICGASAEVILRGGKGTVIPGANGDGLADLTNGDDLAGGVEVPRQHHLLVSRDDGRGILITEATATGKAYILVKGDYTLE